MTIVQDRDLKSPELTGGWEAKLRQIERGRLNPGQFMAEIIGYTREIIRSGGAAAIDPGRLGDCPRCGAPGDRGQAATSVARAGARAARSCSRASTAASRWRRTSSVICSSAGRSLTP